jgi:hypothetical protein
MKPVAPRIDPFGLDLDFPEPAEALLQGPGDACTWQECMRETAAQTIYYLKHYGHLPPPPPPDEPFSLDPEPSKTSADRTNRETATQAAFLALLPPGAELSASALRAQFGLKHRANFRDRYLNPALLAGLIERTRPATPSSPLQRYRRPAR